MPSYIGELITTPWGEQRQVVEVEDADHYLRRVSDAAIWSAVRHANFDRDSGSGRTTLVERTVPNPKGLYPMQQAG